MWQAIPLLNKRGKALEGIIPGATDGEATEVWLNLDHLAYFTYREGILFLQFKEGGNLWLRDACLHGGATADSIFDEITAKLSAA